MLEADTEEKLIAEFAALAKRAIALGRKLGAEETKARIMRAASGEPPASPRQRLPKAALKTHADKPRAGRKYPYGHVTSSLKNALKAHKNGMKREDIGPYCREKLGADIDEDSLRNAIKQLIRIGKMERRGNLHFWSGE